MSVEENYDTELVELAKKLFKAFHGYFKEKNPQHEHTPWNELKDLDKGAWLELADVAHCWCLDYE